MAGLDIMQLNRLWGLKIDVIGAVPNVGGDRSKAVWKNFADGIIVTGGKNRWMVR